MHREKDDEHSRVRGDGRSREMEVEVRTCKVYMWKAVWAVEGLHLIAGAGEGGLMLSVL